MDRAPFVGVAMAGVQLAAVKKGIKNVEYDDGTSESFSKLKDLRKRIKEYEEEIKKLEDRLANAETEGEVQKINAEIQAVKNKKETLEEFNSTAKSATTDIVGGSFAGLNKLVDSIRQAKTYLEDMGVNFGDAFDDALDTTQEIVKGVEGIAQGIMSGNVLQALMGLLQTLAAIFQIHDKRNERQIQDNIKAVEKLGKAYEKLEKKIDEAYSIKTLQSATNGAISNLEEQIRIQEETIALEKDKKNSDEDKIAEYEEQLAQQQEQLEELKKEVVSKATAGAFDDVLSVADEFVDAWLEAFKETGDGLSGLEDNFNEFMLNIIKRQASLQIVGAFADKWKQQLEKYVNANDTELTTAEATAFAESVKADMPELSEALKAYFEAMKSAVDIDGQGDTMSGLQRGIHELSEDTGGVIAAYLDSIRFFVSDSNMQLKQLVTQFNVEAFSAPIVAELQAQTRLITSIDDRLASITRPESGTKVNISLQ